MRKIFVLLGVAVLTLSLTGCPSEQTARDAIAASAGSIAKAQSIYGDDCLRNPRESYCELINQAVRAHNLAITSLETYCGLTQSPVPPPPEAPCVPQKSAAGALQSSVNNLTRITKEINALIARKQTGGK